MTDPRCDNPTCPHKGKFKYPPGKGINPEEELVLVELLIRLPGRLPEIASMAWICYTPCLGFFGKNQVKRFISECQPGGSVVHWRYYADHRYASAKDFAEVLPGVFEQMLHSTPKPTFSSSFFHLFRRWKRP